MPRIAIAGAGIGGLTAALALARAGCSVTVLERTETLAAFGAGLQLSPNATAILARLGLLDALRDSAVAPSEVLVRRGSDGTELAHIPLAGRGHGTPFLVVLRADLQSVLVDAATQDSAIDLRFGCGVTSCSTAPDGTVRVATDDPRRPAISVDGLVACDGIRSAIRRQFTDGASDDSVASGRSAWRSLIDCEAVARDAVRPRANLWLGARAHLVHYPVALGRSVNVVAIVDDEARPPDDASFWSTPADAGLLHRRFAEWAAPARELIRAAPHWRRWPLFDRPPLRRWSRGGVTLLGDAAHPMLPFLAQGAAQAIEDAAVLADCVAGQPADLAAAFSRYEGLRRPRTARVQRESRSMARVYHLRRPASLLRDAVLRSLGPRRLAARYDWLYAGPDPVRHGSS